MCPISSAQSFMSKPYRTRWRSYSASMRRTNTATSGGQIRQVLFSFQNSFTVVIVALPAHLFPEFVNCRATCCAAFTNSDVWRTNLFLVWGLVHRGMSMQRTRTAMPGGQITSFYLRSETCSHGEMWLRTIKEKIGRQSGLHFMKLFTGRKVALC